MIVGVLFVAALPWEASTILRQIRGLRRESSEDGTLWKGCVPYGEIAVLQTGIGPQRAERALSWAGEIVAPQAVVATGCAGGLAPSFRTGDLLIAEEIHTPEGLRQATSAEWVERYSRAAEASGCASRRGRLLASSSLLMSIEEKARMGSASGALAVAMEEGAIAAWAADRGVDLASVRVILDPAEVAIPKDISSLTGTRGRALPHRLLALIVRRPGVVREFLRLGSALRACRSTLEAVHRSVLETPRKR